MQNSWCENNVCIIFKFWREYERIFLWGKKPKNKKFDVKQYNRPVKYSWGDPHKRLQKNETAGKNTRQISTNRVRCVFRYARNVSCGPKDTSRTALNLLVHKITIYFLLLFLIFVWRKKTNDKK